MRHMFRQHACSRNILIALAVNTVMLGAITTASASATTLEWHKNSAPLTKTEEITMKGGEQVVGFSGKEIKCKTIQGTGTISPGAGGKGVSTLKFSECTTTQRGCVVSNEANESFTMKNIPTALVEAKTSSGGTVIADDLVGNKETGEFVTVQFTPLSGYSCSNYPTTKIEGGIIAEVVNASEELRFPNPELEGNSLVAFGIQVYWIGGYKQELKNGGALTAVR